MKWSIEQRRERLGVLYDVISRREDEIALALWADLHKNAGEAYMTEIGIVLHEIRTMRKHMAGWLKPKRVRMPLFAWPSRGKVVLQPYGRVLIIAPWNYPFQLVMMPLVGAVAAGNTVVVKASPDAPATQSILGEILCEVFCADQVLMEIGGEQKVRELLEDRWDYIFFTGSGATGRIVARAAAEKLTPTTLELGGKSPCVVAQDADLRVAARRVVWGKFLNAGQTCVAPDFLFVHHSEVDEFERLLNEQIELFFGKDPKSSPMYGRIVNDRAFDRLVGLYPMVHSDRSQRYIAPTVVRQHNVDQEIFGPVLPLLSYDSMEQVIDYINEREKPLALYYFGNNPSELLQRCDSGSVCINDTIMQLSCSTLPFGGVGSSGMGQYHGRFSIQTFTHPRSVVRSRCDVDVKMRYNPLRYNKLIKMFLK